MSEQANKKLVLAATVLGARGDIRYHALVAAARETDRST
jgi:hypothetical protein